MEQLTYDIVFLNQSLSDLDSIHFAIMDISQSETTANTIINRILNSIESLKIFPKRFKVLIINNNYNIRMFISNKYSIYYFIKENKVHIVRILYYSNEFTI
ncbi:type II toxin-antitoxin system RelE/ParE family toxin [Macrococcoides canis]|uniref:type II toxin-antitoxin system RelE/ParE family toxin n=1 Tax=Macrococcoides canis TaxID=1855823 RepID=UPI0020B70D23|nr:type II toxin-antitoxin system RelE/ParE family toxin [Macrococcus canis]UTG99640.1 type II toxin-antitoxin system RelE/ParE family toxin [Macrococcus canis]